MNPAPANSNTAGAGPKTYQLHSAPASALQPKQRTAIFYKALKAAKARVPGLNPHALTTKIFGSFKNYQDLSEADFWQLVTAFKQVAQQGHCSASAAQGSKFKVQGSKSVPAAVPAPVPPPAPVAAVYDRRPATSTPPAPAPATVRPSTLAPRPSTAPAAPSTQDTGHKTHDFPPSALYTAKELAAALAVSKQAVLKRLAATSAQVRIVAGNPANAWPLSALPAEWQHQLADLATRGGYRSPHHLLTGEPPAQFEPPLPLAECAASAIEQAMKLRTALAGALARRNELTGPDLADLGLVDYQKAFGHVVTRRHWWALLQRTLDRAGSREDFLPLELYLDESPARKVTAQPVPAAETECERLHRLHVAAARCVNPTAPTDAEQAALWEAACATLAAELEMGVPPHRARRAILDYLWKHAPGLAVSEHALGEALRRKFERFRVGGFKVTALADKRAEANRERAVPVSQADLDVLIGRAVFVCDGRVSQAVRECLQQRLVSEELLARITATPSRKSYVPTSLRDRVKHEVAMLREVHHGPTATRDNGAYLNRCWDSVASLDWYCADDCTLPVYFYVPDPEAKCGFTLMRGQFLLMIDTRTTAILGYALMPSRNYNAKTIRSLITRTADEYGLPRKGLLFEMGIWKNAKILTGDKGETDVPFAETEQGLKEFGLQFRHAIRARTKPVERVLGALQNYMEGEPGYCGREERHAGFESFARLKQDIAAGRVNPTAKLYSMEQWDARLGELCARYNAEPQEGKHTGGLSPEAALKQYQLAGDPTVRFDERCRYLLANHRKPVTVTKNGIRLENAYYLNDRTGPLRGQTVLAWYDPEALEVITVTDMERRNAFCVARQQAVPAMDAPEELLAQELGRIGAHAAFATTRYRTLKPKFPLAFRANVVSPQIEEVGQTIAAGRQQAKAESATRTKARKAAEGIGMRAENLRRPDQIEAAEELSRLLQEVNSSEATQ